MEKIKVKACCVSTDFKTSNLTLDLSKKSNLILPFIGLHPEKALDDLEPIVGLIEKNSGKISGIGEIGLDKTYESGQDENIQKQRSIFETQLGIAERLQKPVSIHSRKTLDEIFEILSSFSVQNVLLHWFDGNKKQLRRAMDMGFFVSYGPVMVYADDKKSLLAKTDKNKILVETDGPVRFAKCFGFKPAQIDFLPSVVFCASKVLAKSYDETAILLEQNSKEYLKI